MEDIIDIATCVILFVIKVTATIMHKEQLKKPQASD